MSNVKVTKDPNNQTITIERAFNAPRELVWKAYTDKEWYEAWWGPEGWQTTAKVFEFRPGGKVHYCMKCVDENQGEWYGQESWGLVEIETIDEPSSFTAIDHFSNPEGTVDENLPTLKFVINFIEEGEQTRLVNQVVAHSAEQLEQLINMGMVEGFSSQLNKLESLLTEKETS